MYSYVFISIPFSVSNHNAQESATILEELSNSLVQKTPVPTQMLKHTFRLWRDRLPNKWDPVNEWEDVLGWRIQMFNKIQDAVKQHVPAAKDDPQLMAGIQDMMWTTTRLAKVARKQALYEIALGLLSRTHSCMDVADAFNNVREQIVVCHKAAINALNPSAADVYRRSGLHLINSTYLDKLNSEQAAELFRLKGLFLASATSK